MRWIAFVAMLIAGFANAQSDRAPAYPAKPLRIICNAAPGGVPDVAARLIADKLTVSMGQAVIVENRPGALGTIATAQLAKAAPAGAPKAIIDRIATEIGRAVDHPDVKNRLASMGMDAVTDSSPEAFGTLFRAEFARWGKVIKEAGIRVE